MPGKCHGQRSLVGYSPWGRKESDTTEQLHFTSFHFSDQCKEIEEKNRKGKTRDLFKKARDTKGTFHAKMGSINDRNGRDLTEAEDINKRWQDYTEELYKKDLHNPDTHNGVITHHITHVGIYFTSWNMKSNGP